MTRGGLFLPIMAALLGALLLIIAYFGDTMHPVIRAIIALCGAAFLIYGGLETINWIMQVAADNALAFRRAAAVTERVAAIEAYARLNKTQAEALMQVGAMELIVEPHRDTVPLEIVRMYLDGAPVDIPRADVDKFTAWSEGGYLPSIRDAGADGSNARRFAVAITGWLVANGYADPADGNRPAKWRSAEAYKKAMKAMGYKL